MGELLNYIRTYYQYSLSDVCCQIEPIYFQTSQDITVDESLYAKSLSELGLDGSEIDVYSSPTLQKNIRGMFFEEDGRYVILLNPKTAGDNTLLHELRHVYQRQNGVLRLRPGLEADAQRYSDLRESDYRGLVRRN